MLRDKKLVIVSQCVLNQNSVVHYLARQKGAFTRVVQLIMDSGHAVYQLPCPELRFGSMKRPQQTFSQYNTAEYIMLCEKIVNDAMIDIQYMLEDDVKLCGIVGIACSPTCDNSQGHLYRLLLPRIHKIYKREFWVTDIPKDYTGNEQQDFDNYFCMLLNK